MMKDINYWFTWAISSGFLVGLIAFAWSYIRPVLETKKQHAKTIQQKETIDLVEKLADMAVSSLAGNTDITGHDKFQAATRYVGTAMAEHGHAVSQETVNHAVQAAYEKSDLTPTVDPTQKPQTGVVVHNG